MIFDELRDKAWESIPEFLRQRADRSTFDLAWGMAWQAARQEGSPVEVAARDFLDLLNSKRQDDMLRGAVALLSAAELKLGDRLIRGQSGEESMSEELILRKCSMAASYSSGERTRT